MPFKRRISQAATMQPYVYPVVYIQVLNDPESLTGERYPGFVNAVRDLGPNGESTTVWIQTPKGRTLQTGRAAVSPDGHLVLIDDSAGGRRIGTVRQYDGGLFYHHEI